ncbi:UNKNOWN [Stylonychia lemnae]|uniref:Uncharacterized protein n=1 Tax=Stylonychia lemnae TaxID=5949 RepID=A0A078A8Y0_STYLE|nr:UNKNOWN [Stylonychia lemnae]|eukprot:CDW78730.1 UNKNOWN [Stylonychia lemnae]
MTHNSQKNFQGEGLEYLTNLMLMVGHHFTAAETCAIDCAKILLEHNADIDAQNFSGQTSFHVCAEKQDFVFGKFLLKNRARKNCRSGCNKCRFFVKQIERHDRNQREYELKQQQNKLEEQKILEQDKEDQKLAEQLSQLDLMEEIQKCRVQTGGPFFNKRENKRLREQQEKVRKEEELRQQQLMKLQQARRGNVQTQPFIRQQVDGSELNKSQDSEQIQPQIRPSNNSKQNEQESQMIKEQNPVKKEFIKSQNSQQSRPNITSQTQVSPREKAKLKNQTHIFMDQPKDDLMPPPYISESQGNQTSVNPRKKNKKRRQKQTEIMEEEKKMAKSQCSQEYESEGDIQAFYK